MPTILCVTPNTAVDHTLVVRGYGRGGVFRPSETLIAAGGKGINVARAVKLLGGDSWCAGFTAGHSGRLVADLLTAEGIPARWTHLEGRETRTCLLLVDPDAEQVSAINEHGPQVSGEDWARLRADVLAVVAEQAPDAICFCGSLPLGSPVEAYTDLLAALHDAGQRVWVDTSGTALGAAVGVGGLIIKVNDDEAGALLDQRLDSEAAVRQAAAQLQARTGAPVVITLGARGAALVDGAQFWRAIPPPIRPLSTVGSGDSFLAGLVLARLEGAGWDEALRSAVAAGAANTLCIGGARFTLEDYHDLHGRTEVSS